MACTRRLVGLGLALTLAAGCGGGIRPEVLKGWVGRPAAALEKDWGPATREVPDGEVVSLAAVLKDKVFVGATWRLYLALSGGQEIAAEPGSSMEAERLQPGDPTTVHWRRDAARLLQD